MNIQSFFLLTSFLVSEIYATFDATASTLVTTLIEEVFSTPETHAALLQYGFESRFFLNDSGIEYGYVSSMMYGQIKVLPTSFYHLWSCFENGAFLGYYQKDINIPDRYTIGWQSNANHSCDGYNVSLDDSPWTGCREFFVANRENGLRAASYNAVPYDCRSRSWYIATKGSVAKRWADVWIDVTANKAALGLCVPLTNLTTKATDYQGVHADEHGLVGVACTGVFLEAISISLLSSFTDLAGGKNSAGLGAFVVDRTTGLLIAAGTSEPSDYFDFTTQTQVLPYNSPNDAIRFAARVILNHTNASSGDTDDDQAEWPDSYTTVAWVRNSSLTYPMLTYEAYYVSTKVMRQPGLEWDLVVFQEVNCPVNYYVDLSTLVCTECVSPRSAAGGGSSSCDSCVTGYYLDKNNECEQCPSNGQCEGGLYYPRPNRNYWVDRSESSDSKKSTRMHKCPRSTCQGTESDVCWLSECFGENNDVDKCEDCQDERLQCKTGSCGPLCGSCEEGYIFQASVNSCKKCDEVQEFACAISISLCLALVGGVTLYRCKHRLRKLYRFVFRPFRFLDTGCLKVMWVTYQIIVAASFTLDVQYPYPFTEYLQLLSIFSFDFLALECLNRGANAFYNTVYLWCCLPIALAVVIVLIGFLRVATLRGKQKLRSVVPLSFSSYSTPPGTPSKEAFSSMQRRQSFTTGVSGTFDEEANSTGGAGESNNCDTPGTSLSSMDTGSYDGYVPSTDSSGTPTSEREYFKQRIIHQHLWLLLLLSYIVLPVVSRKQLQTYDCISLNDHLYLSSNTAIDCSASEYIKFRGVILMFIILYQTIPVIWMYALYTRRDLLNPPINNMLEAYDVRDNNKELQALKFLFVDYKCSSWWWEIVEMYRRIIFIGVLPLISASGMMRASCGCIIAIMSVALVREVQPYRVEFINVIANVAQFTILLTYFAAFSILAGGIFDFGLGELGVGLYLVFINSVILFMVIYFAVLRYRIERLQNKWKHKLNSQELHIVNKVMGPMGGTGSKLVATTETGVKITDSNGSTKDSTLYAKMNKRYLIRAQDIVMIKKVGAGAFGEVFKGSYLTQPVAVKTMIDVTISNVKSFRSEILLTASLRHPNIVNFVGACWGKDLMCLVLEWVERGSLSDLLDMKGLKWQDPLFRLACDVVRGMTYLHSRVFFDENKNKTVSCILHRDLKPSNALITNYTTAKLADFGTSRSILEEDVETSLSMTSIGTPLYVAPEIARGEHYDEKVDVYSFGITLAEMCVEEHILQTIGARYMKDFRKKRIPRQPMRFIRPMTEEGWRPITEKNPIPFAPPSINTLIVKCCDHVASKRPSFVEILEELNDKCKDEIEKGTYGRKPKKSKKCLEKQSDKIFDKEMKIQSSSMKSINEVFASYSTTSSSEELKQDDSHSEFDGNDDEDEEVRTTGGVDGGSNGGNESQSENIIIEPGQKDVCVIETFDNNKTTLSDYSVMASSGRPSVKVDNMTEEEVVSSESISVETETSLKIETSPMGHTNTSPTSTHHKRELTEPVVVVSTSSTSPKLQPLQPICPSPGFKSPGVKIDDMTDEEVMSASRANKEEEEDHHAKNNHSQHHAKSGKVVLDSLHNTE